MKKTMYCLGIFALIALGAITCMGFPKHVSQHVCTGEHRHEICDGHHSEKPYSIDDYYRCSTCDGSGRDSRIKCRACHGNGTIMIDKTCNQCNGTGSKRDVYGNIVRCYYCEGKGTTRVMIGCSSCDGWGCVICSNCNGSGRVWIDE